MSNNLCEEEEEVEYDENGLPTNLEYLPNGLPKNYASIVKRGDPDGNDPNNPVRIYADGVFDMYHVGHAKVLKQAKQLFKHVYLTVGVSGDDDVLKYKGQYVMSQQERGQILKHCKWVDEVICPCPWKTTPEWARSMGFHYMAHDDIPYTMGADSTNDVYYDIKKAGMWRTTQRTQGVSTSDVVLRIIKDYDMYVERNLKRDYTPSDLGISHFKANRIKLKQWAKKNDSHILTAPIRLCKRGFQQTQNISQSIWDYMFKPAQNQEQSSQNLKESQVSKDICDEEVHENQPGEAQEIIEKVGDTLWQRIYQNLLGHGNSPDKIDEEEQEEEESANDEQNPRYLNKRNSKAERKQKKFTQ